VGATLASVQQQWRMEQVKTAPIMLPATGVVLKTLHESLNLKEGTLLTTFQGQLCLECEALFANLLIFNKSC
jgi:hypothetical protein